MRIHRVPQGDVAELKIKAFETIEQPGGQRIAFGVAEFPRGTRHPPEGQSSHPAAEATTILEGRFEFYSGTETRIVSAGDIIYLEPGEPQGCLALEDSRVLFTVVGRELPDSFGPSSPRPRSGS